LAEATALARPRLAADAHGALARVLDARREKREASRHRAEAARLLERIAASLEGIEASA
jgi:hypothetical protein